MTKQNLFLIRSSWKWVYFQRKCDVLGIIYKSEHLNRESRVISEPWSIGEFTSKISVFGVTWWNEVRITLYFHSLLIFMSFVLWKLIKELIEITQHKSIDTASWSINIYVYRVYQDSVWIFLAQILSRKCEKKNWIFASLQKKKIVEDLHGYISIFYHQNCINPGLLKRYWVSLS